MRLEEEFHKPRPPLAGYVYLMRNARGWYKIGHSVNPRRRRGELSSQANPVKIALLIPTRDMVALELALQRGYVHKRTHHEWYRLEKTDIKALVQTHGAIRYNPATFDWKTGQVTIINLQENAR